MFNRGRSLLFAALALLVATIAVAQADPKVRNERPIPRTTTTTVEATTTSTTVATPPATPPTLPPVAPIAPSPSDPLPHTL
jgi:hypothetical protein